MLIKPLNQKHIFIKKGEICQLLFFYLPKNSKTSHDKYIFCSVPNSIFYLEKDYTQRNFLESTFSMVMFASGVSTVEKVQQEEEPYKSFQDEQRQF